MRGFGRLVGRALFVQRSKAATKENGFLLIPRRLINVASSTTSFLANRNALSTGGFSSLRSPSVGSLYSGKWTVFGGAFVSLELFYLALQMHFVLLPAKVIFQ